MDKIYTGEGSAVATVVLERVAAVKVVRGEEGAHFTFYCGTEVYVYLGAEAASVLLNELYQAGLLSAQQLRLLGGL